MNQAILKNIDTHLQNIIDELDIWVREFAPWMLSKYDLASLKRVILGNITGINQNLNRLELSSLPSDTQWIDMKNWNPKWFCNYIVTNGKSSFEAWYSDIDNIFKHIDDSWNCKWITHYMEFPNPPKR